MPNGYRLAVLSRTALEFQTQWQGDPGLPYGLQHLEHQGFSLRWSNAPYEPGWANSLPMRAARRAETTHESLRGSAQAFASRNIVAHADSTLTIFEDVGLAAARLRALGIRPYADRPLTVLTCWLAEDFPRLSKRRQASVRAALAGATGMLVYSTNQVELLTTALGLPGLRIEAVPFGVDTDFYTPSGGDRTQEILAVGRDRSRDYRTFLDAVRGTGWNVQLVCSEYNLAGLDIPDEVTAHLDVDHATYRTMLRRAGVVVTPTHAPAYPGGQSTLLEAMSTGAPCVITNSLAIQDYVCDGEDAVLVPRNDAKALRDAISSLMSDPLKRAELGAAAHRRVVRDFGFASSWQAIGASLRGSLAPE